MRKLILSAAALAAVISAVPAEAQRQTAPSSGRKDQAQGMAEIPLCTHRIGTLAIVEPETQWWRQLNLGSPEAIIRVFVQKSGCFTLVNRGRSLQSRAMEKALAEQGEDGLDRDRTKPAAPFKRRGGIGRRGGTQRAVAGQRLRQL